MPPTYDRPVTLSTRLALAALACIHLALSSCWGGAQEHRSVVLITIDTLRADHLGCYGFDLQVSPNIDALAAGGVLFERAVAASGVTAPSHASIMTSLYARQHSIGPRNGFTRLLDETTLAESFREAGYETAAFVSNVVLKRRIGLDRGFQVYDDEMPSPVRTRPSHFERVAELTTQRAVAWLERPRETRFFLWVHYQDPHGPYDPPEDFLDRIPYRPPPTEAALPVLEKQHGEGGIPAYQATGEMRLPSRYRHRYAGEILYADHWVGELLRVVRALEGGGETIVVLTADHGESFGEGGFYFAHGHTTTPDLSHVPFILSAAELAPERRAELVSHVDIMPTLLELAGHRVPRSAQGIALGPFLRDGEPLPDRVVSCDVPDDVSAYRGDLLFRRSRRILPASRRPPLQVGGYRWDTEGTLSRTRDALPLREEIRSYLRSEVPTVEIETADREEESHLRALGYLEPEASEAK
jgi:arylsulfatase A-like enzyme